MRRVVLLLVGVLALTAVVIGVSDRPEAIAQDSRSIHVESVVVMPDGDPGATCMPFDPVEVMRETKPPYRQVVITDQNRAIVGVVDIIEGTVTESDGLTRCVVAADLVIPDAPFYTFTVEGLYTWTISRETLEDNGWTYTLVLD